MKRTILVQSSSGNGSYSVEFLLHEGKLSIFCDCQAGKLGKFCKHKIGMLYSDEKLLLDLVQLPVLEEALVWVKESELSDLLEQFKQAEINLKAAEKQLVDLKKTLEKAMRNGI